MKWLLIILVLAFALCSCTVNCYCPKPDEGGYILIPKQENITIPGEFYLDDNILNVNDSGTIFAVCVGDDCLLDHDLMILDLWEAIR